MKQNSNLFSLKVGVKVIFRFADFKITKLSLNILVVFILLFTSQNKLLASIIFEKTFSVGTTGVIRMQFNNSIEYSSNAYYFCGSTQTVGSYTLQDAIVVKTDSTGRVYWTKVYDTGNADGAYSLCKASDGGLVIAGSTGVPGSGYLSDMFVFKIDSSGNVQWSFASPGNAMDGVVYIQEALDGGYFVSGTSSSFIAGDYTTYIIKLDVNGHKEWSRFFLNPSIGLFTMSGTSDGGLIFLGASSAFPDNLIIFKIDSAGILQWNKYYENAIGTWPWNVRQTPDDGFLLVGLEKNDSFPTILKTDSVGVPIWARMYTTPDGPIHGVTAEIARDGNLLILGHIPIQNYLSEFSLMKIDLLGNVFWLNRYGPTVGTNYAGTIEQMSDGTYMMLGMATSIMNYGPYVVKADDNGVSPCNSAPLSVTDSSISFHLSSGVNYQSPSEQIWIPQITTSSISILESTLCSSVGLSEMSTELQILYELYPNPFGSGFTIQFSNEEYQNKSIQIVNSFGQIVYRLNSVKSIIEIPTEEWAEGIYFCRVEYDDLSFSIKKIILQKE